ncbi:MAG: condensation domain-containing protein [Verrucomicrobiota bacterium]
MSAPPLSSLDPDWSTPPPASDPCPDPIGLDGLPLSVEQERLFFLEQLEPGTATYNVPLALRLSGPWRVHVLEAALNKIVARHESLRTNFVSVDGRPTQLIHPHRSLAMTFCSHPGEPEADGPGGMTEALVRAARKPFDLAKDLLIRAVLFQLRTDDHVLLLTVHHLVCDEWSMHLLGAELIQLATAFAAGQDSPFPELQVQYGDYAVWQREQLASDAIRGQLAYWKTQLQHGPTRLDLPTDRRPSERRSDEGRCYERLLPDQLGQALEGLAQREGVTPFMTLLASFHAFLGRYVGQDDIIVGTPVAGRSRLETEDIIGFFVNMLPLRANLGGDPNFLELLRRTRQTTLDAYANADVPFHRLVEELQPARRQGRTPLVQVVFAFEQPSLPPMSSPGLGIELLDVHTGTAKFDLTWVVRQAKGRCQLCIEYPIDLFDEPTIGHMAAAWQLLLEGMLAAPERPIARIPMLSAAARARAVSEWNRTDRPYPADSTIPALFEQQVAQHPNALALQYGERKYSYGELNQRANGVALALRTAGAGPGTMVAIWAERSIETIVGLLGILKAGCIYVPVDPASPPDRVRFILAETEAPLLLRCGPLLSPVEASIKILALDTLPDGPENLPKPAHPSPLAYVMYTSGSTGRPRGVLIEQRGVIRLVCNSNYLTWTRADRVAQLSNLCFDAATFEIWGALLNGAALIGIDHDLLLSPQRLALELRGEQVTTLFVTTALFNQIAAEHPGAFKGIKNVLFGGEAVDPKWVSRVLGGDAPERLLHVYGPTEATTFSSWHPITAVPIEATTPPIGRPIATTLIWLASLARTGANWRAGRDLRGRSWGCSGLFER